MRRIIFILITPLIILLTTTAIVNYWLIPKAKVFIIDKTLEYSKKNLPFIIRINDLEFNLLKLKGNIEGITLESTDKDLKKITKDLTIKHIIVNLNPLQILAGKFEISNIEIIQSKALFDFTTLLQHPSDNSALPIEKLFTVIKQIPIESININDGDLTFKMDNDNNVFSTSEFKLKLDNEKKQLNASLDITKSNLKTLDKIETTLETHISAELTNKHLKINKVELITENSNLKASGLVNDIAKIKTHPNMEFNYDVKIELEPVIEKLRKRFKIPKLNGSVETKGTLKINKDKKISSNFQIKTKEVNIESFAIGNSFINGSFDQDTLRIKEVALSHSAGSAKLENAELHLDGDMNFKTNLDVKYLDLQSLFKSIKLDEIPVELQSQGQFKCEGQIKDFKTSCNGKIEGKNLFVGSEYNKQESAIVELNEFKAQGSMTIDLNSVAYKADLQIADKKGFSQGLISYKDGFKIEYKTPLLGFKNLKNLANINFNGDATLTGTTQGDSNAATMDMQLAVKGLEVDIFPLGDVNANLKYEKGHLLIQSIDSRINNSILTGDLNFDFMKSQVEGQIQSEHIEAQDVLFTLKNLFQLPYDLTSAEGKAQIKFYGPLNFWKLNHNLKASFTRGQFATDSFEKLNLETTGKDGFITLNKVLLTKKESSLIAEGTLGSDQVLNLKIKGRNWYLEESELVNKLSSLIHGTLSLDALITGTLKFPQIDIKSAINDASIDETDIPNSYLNLNLSKSEFKGEGHLFGNKIQADFQIPLNKSNTPLKVRAKSTDWNFVDLLAMLGVENLRNEYYSNLNINVDLYSDNGDYNHLKGSIYSDQLLIRRGELEIKNKAPIDIKINEGKVDLSEVKLEGSDSEIYVYPTQFNINKIYLQMQTQVDLRLFQILFPFLDDVGGNVLVSTVVSGDITNPQFFGASKFKNIFLKIKDFPHPFEKLEGELSFSQTKVIIQSFKGLLAGGAINGDGSITIKGFNQFPTYVRIKAENIHLNVPDKVKTNGNAELIFSGNWFPFTLSGTYQVNNGIVEREFTGDEEKVIISGPHEYLPKTLRDSEFNPIILDIQTYFERNMLVKNSLVDGSVQGQLHVKGPPTNPLLLGKVRFDRKSKILFKDKIFEVENGQVVFDNPTTINPNLYLSAQSRVNDYDIQLLVQGAAKSPSIKLNSVPPLPESEIITLLALGITSSNLDKSIQSKDQATQTGYELGAAIIANNQLKKELQRTTGWNVQLTSSFDSSKNISVPKITASKKITRKVNMFASRTVGGDQGNIEVKMQYLINNNLSAIGSYEEKEAQSSTSIDSSTKSNQSVFGLDLEFKKEFK